MTMEWRPGPVDLCLLFNLARRADIAAHKVFHKQQIAAGMLNGLQQRGHGIDLFHLLFHKPLQEIIAGEVIFLDGDAH